MNLKFWQRKPKPLADIPPHDLRRMKDRVGLLASDDPLWPMLRALLKANLLIETEAVAKSGIDDAEAHRSRGRVGMLLDLDAQLGQVWNDSHTAE